MSVKHTHRRSRRRKARVSRPLSSARSPPEKMATASPSLPRGFHGHASTSRNGATGPPSIDVPVVLHLLRETASLSLMDLEEGDGSLPHSYQEQDEETLTHLSAEPLPRWHIPPASGRPDPDGYDTQMNQSITSLHSRIAAHGSPPLGTGGPRPGSTELRRIGGEDPGPGEWGTLPQRTNSDPDARPLPPDLYDVSMSENATENANRMSDSTHLDFFGLGLQRGGLWVVEHNYPGAILDFEEPEMAPSADEEDETMDDLGGYEEGARLDGVDKEWVLVDSPRC